MLAIFHPFGVPIEIRCDGPALAALVRAALAGWEGDPDPAARRLRLDLRVSAALRGSQAPRIGITAGRLRLAGLGALCCADAAMGRALCVLSEDYVADAERLRRDILDTVILFLLARNGRIPIHAAGVLAGERAILLAGPSGVGKSCLAQAALEAGLRILSDDMVHVEPWPSTRVWGMPRPIHLLPGDAPATVANGATRLRNGKLKHVVPTRSGGHGRTGEARALCLLSPGAMASLARIGAAEAVQGLKPLEPGFDLLAPEVEASIAALARRGAWRLTLSADPADAIRLLRANLPRLTRS